MNEAREELRAEIVATLRRDRRDREYPYNGLRDELNCICRIG
jgi:hypothetical protein